MPKIGQCWRGDAFRFAELQLSRYTVTRLGGGRKAILWGYCDPNTKAKRRELVLPSGVDGLCDVRGYDVLRGCQSEELERCRQELVRASLYRCLDVLMALYEYCTVILW